VFKIERKLTSRGIVYTGYKCQLDCEFCYYRFKTKSNRSLRDVKADLIKAKFYYKLDWVDISGGEPTIYKHIEEVLKFCKVIGLKTTVITNGICINEKLDSLVDEWLVSIHSVGATHNKCVGKDVFNIVATNLRKIKKPFRVNNVITKRNYKKFPELAEWLGFLLHKPTRVHYIMFNPFHEFTREPEIDFLANPTDVGKYLKEAIDILEAKDIKVVVRYLPFCMLKGYEDRVCGMTQIAYDFGEWNWNQQFNSLRSDKPEQEHYGLARSAVINNSTDMPECRHCAAEFICDKMMLSYLKQFRDLKPVAYKGEKTFDPLYFKK